MQEYIIAGAGIVIAIICCIFGWWMENGPEKTDPKNEKNRSSGNDLE